MKTLLVSAVLLSSLAFAAAPTTAAPQRPANWAQGDGTPNPARMEEMAKHRRMMLVVGLAEALNYNETQAIQLADQMKTFDTQREPIRAQMGTAMKTLKAASEGDTTALASVDQATNQVLEGRMQMAALDKQMFAQLSKNMQPQQRAQLAIFLARFQGMGHKGMMGDHKGRAKH